MNPFIWSPEQLCSLFDIEWEKTQLCALLPKLELPTYCSIGGGAIVRTLLKQDIFKGDLDIFPHTFDALEAAIEKYGKDPTWEKTPFSYSRQFKDGVKTTKLQVITKTAPRTVIDTMKHFDFEHCKFVLFNDVLKGSVANPRLTFVSTPSSHMFLATKQIRLGFIEDPVYSLGRAIKYKRLGFDADKAIEQLVAMSMKKMTNVQCYNDDDWSGPHTPAVIDKIIATASS